MKKLIKPIECGESDVLVECEQLAGVSVNVCGAAEAPEEQAGKWMASLANPGVLRWVWSNYPELYPQNSVDYVSTPSAAARSSYI